MAAVTRASLVAEPVWVAWRQETRKGKVTKVPYSPLTGQRAQTDNPETWATRDASDAWAETHQAAGVGLMFAQVGDDFIGGVDLDSCRDRNTGEIAGWAQVVIERFDTYAEVSPSETGVKLFFVVRRADLAKVEELFGGASNFGRKFERRNGSAHAPPIEIYRRGRFFTVTEMNCGQSEELRPIDPPDLEWLLQDYGPKFAGKDKAADDAGDDRPQSDWPTDFADHGSEPMAGNLHARLEVEIRAARFVVAELSHHNNGAYWEAGFAKGLGKPVIYMYNKTLGKSGRPHFDVGSDLYIAWEEDKPEKAADELKAVIRATLFEEAVMED
jgi:hypothetical protein